MSAASTEAVPQDEDMLANLKEQVRLWGELLAGRQSSLAYAEQMRDQVIADRKASTQALADAVKKKVHFQMQSRLWKGLIAVRKTSLAAAVREKKLAKADNAWYASRIRRSVRETLPLQRECQTLSIPTNMLKQEIAKWRRDRAEDIACYAKWREEEISAGRAQ